VLIKYLFLRQGEWQRTVIICKFQHVMYRVTTVKMKRRYTPSVHVKCYGRLPYGNAVPLNPVTFQ